MTAKELIIELKKCPENAIVVYYNTEYGGYIKVDMADYNEEQDRIELE